MLLNTPSAVLAKQDPHVLIFTLRYQETAYNFPWVRLRIEQDPLDSPRQVLAPQKVPREVSLCVVGRFLVTNEFYFGVVY